MNWFLESFVSIVQKDNGVTDIMGFVYGLGPNPVHGFHIHEFGDLSDGCQSCGGHFNPYHVKNIYMLQHYLKNIFFLIIKIIFMFSFNKFGK